jgi:hypothetical protein
MAHRTHTEQHVSCLQLLLLLLQLLQQVTQHYHAICDSIGQRWQPVLCF